ncbi:MAG: cation:proton antiporter [Pseudomonadota bacterium]|nr:cation:proton antiporter [Pseudomonadota bacterium]
MDVHHQITFIALVVGGALLCGLALARLRQPAIVGYILAGVVLGPSGLGLVEDRDQINLLAELGVLMLLFLIGMELSLRAFKTVWRIALLGTGLQIGGALATMLLFSLVLGWPLELAMLLGFVVALSSTAVAIKMLDEIDELRSEVGRRAVAILIAQDLAVVPMMLVLNAMASEGGFGFIDLLPIALAVGFLVLFVHHLSRRERVSLPFGRWIVGDHDLTPLAALAWCFAAATISGLLGLSAAYGAFLAGLLVGSSTERQTIIAATRPIQSVLLMVFFLSIGLLIDLAYIWDNLASVLVLLVIVTLGKTAMNIGALRLLGEPWPRAFLTGTVLGQVGEFSFVIAALGLGNGLIDSGDHRLVVTIIALSLVISPLWLDVARRLHDMAAGGISSLNGLLKGLYPGEAQALRETAGEAARGSVRIGAMIRRWYGQLRRRAANSHDGTPDDGP